MPFKQVEGQGKIQKIERETKKKRALWAHYAYSVFHRKAELLIQSFLFFFCFSKNQPIWEDYTPNTS